MVIMNLQVRFFYIFIVAVLSFTSQYAQCQNRNDEKEVLKLLNEFYHKYITENSKVPLDEVRINSIKAKYCTSRLINRIKNQRLDYDPFLNAQDCDITWLETLVVNKGITQNQYIVSYKDNFTKNDVIIKLNVVKQGGSFKIDSIL